jgi:beta-D-xylosidase 4
LDLDCGQYYPNFTANAVRQGKVQVKDIDTSLENLYVVLLRLGYFDGIRAYEKLGKGDICTKHNIRLAAQSAREGIVLLKNDETLPFSRRSIRRIAVVGPHANATKSMIGNYAGTATVHQAS